jgi:hypothetical protein
MNFQISGIKLCVCVCLSLSTLGSQRNEWHRILQTTWNVKQSKVLFEIMPFNFSDSDESSSRN